MFPPLPSNNTLHLRSCLVALADEVVGERLDGGGSVSGNGAVGVVAYNDGLLGLGDGNTGATLILLASAFLDVSFPGGRVVQIARRCYGPRRGS